jgi:hypothetical protein
VLSESLLMKIQLNPHALAAAATLAGAVFFGAPGAYAQQTPPAATTAAPPAATPPAATPPAAPAPATPAPPAAEPPPAAPPESKIKAAPPPPPVQRRVTRPVVAAGIISLVGLAGGVTFGILAAGKNSAYKKSPSNDDALDGERSAFIADVSFGVAALFGLTAIALYMLPDEPPPPDTAPAAPPKASKRTWLTAALKGEVFSF